MDTCVRRRKGREGAAWCPLARRQLAALLARAEAGADADRAVSFAELEAALKEAWKAGDDALDAAAARARVCFEGLVFASRAELRAAPGDAQRPCWLWLTLPSADGGAGAGELQHADSLAQRRTPASSMPLAGAAFEPLGAAGLAVSPPGGGAAWEAALHSAGLRDAWIATLQRAAAAAAAGAPPPSPPSPPSLSY